MANPVGSVSNAHQVAQVATKTHVPDAKPAPKQQVIPQDSVSISQSGKAAGQAQAAAKIAQPADESETTADTK
ncbi:MAG: hypothetical protein WB987_03195 [Candidatus Acidiferrales bacterium]